MGRHLPIASWARLISTFDEAVSAWCISQAYVPHIWRSVWRYWKWHRAASSSTESRHHIPRGRLEEYNEQDLNEKAMMYV